MPVGVAIDAEHTDGGRGWLGRVGGGCDYQFWQKFVVGALADYDFASLKGNITAPGFAASGDEKMTWAWAAGGRLGYLPWDTLMVYISGGYTQAHFNGTIFSPTLPLLLSALPIPVGFWAAVTNTGSICCLVCTGGLNIASTVTTAKTTNFSAAASCWPTEFVHSEKFVQTVTSSLVWRFNWWR